MGGKEGDQGSYHPLKVQVGAGRLAGVDSRGGLAGPSVSGGVGGRVGGWGQDPSGDPPGVSAQR